MSELCLRRDVDPRDSLMSSEQTELHDPLWGFDSAALCANSNQITDPQNKTKVL